MQLTSNLQNTTLQVATVLSLLLSSLPEASKEKRMVSVWQSEFDAHSRKSSRRETVIKAVVDGYDTLDEIAAHTQISRSTVYKIIKLLVKQKVIIEHEIRRIGCRKKVCYEMPS